jgi:hypothetical protein
MQNKPNFPKHKNNHNICYCKELREYTTLQPTPKQTQSNPIPNLLFASSRRLSASYQLPFMNPAYPQNSGR